MAQATVNQRDPVGLTMLICAGFFLLCLIRISIPSTPYFDEVHYLPAVRAMLEVTEWLNREHPLFGKDVIGLGIVIAGDNPLGWRLPSLIFGAIGLFAAMRALWFASQSRFASLAFGILLASGFYLFVHSRIAMLDIFMVSLFAVAMWQCAAAIREPEHGRIRLAIAGLALGLSMASKWNVLILAMLPGLAFFGARLSAGRRRLLTSKRGLPVPGVSLMEAALLLGLLPLVAYWAAHIPAYFVGADPLKLGGFADYQREVLSLQQSVKEPHPYQSIWSDWVLNIRAIWYLYEPVDGWQRGIMLIGNPLTMLLGLPALIWCAAAGIMRRRSDLIAVVILYLVSIGMWLVVEKPIQFAYHYFLPSCFLLAALALALDEFWRRDNRAIPVTVLAASTAIFAFFYPILSAAPLSGEYAFETWTWIEGWR